MGDRPRPVCPTRGVPIADAARDRLEYQAVEGSRYRRLDSPRFGLIAVSRADRALILTVALGAMLAPLNSTMIAIALLPIVDDFHTTLAAAGWLVTAYLLALVVVLPLAGKLGDRYGRRAFVLGGLLGFGVASLGAAVAPSLALLVAFRLAQAVACAVVVPNGVGLIRDSIAAERRGRAFGILAGSLALAAGLGPPLGGLLVLLGGWRAVFYVNLPLVGVALVIAWRTLPRHPVRRPTTPFDWLGAVLLTVVLGGAAALAVEGRHEPSALVPGIPLLALVMFLFVRRELADADPVFQPRFFTRRAFAAANGAVSFNNLAFYTTLLATPILLTRHLHWAPVEVGLALTLLSGPIVVFSPIGGRLADRFGRRLPAVVGSSLLTVGLLPLAVAPEITVYGLLAALTLAGTGIGLANAGMQASAVEAIDTDQAGAAAGSLLDLSLHRRLRGVDRGRTPVRRGARTRGVPNGFRDRSHGSRCVGRRDARAAVMAEALPDQAECSRGNGPTLRRYRDAWVHAADRTPHGSPIELTPVHLD